MLDKIDELINSRDYGIESPKEMEILRLIEAAGMTPPATTIFNTDDENIPTWEPEDG